jgi:hypothetical protein
MFAVLAVPTPMCIGRRFSRLREPAFMKPHDFISGVVSSATASLPFDYSFESRFPGSMRRSGSVGSK